MTDRRWRIALVGTGVLATAACHRAPEPDAVPARHSGAYQIRANLKGTVLDATMILIADTVLLTSPNVQCRPSVASSGTPGIRYECVNVGQYDRVELFFDRGNPIQGSTWRGTRLTRIPKRVCVQFRQSASGQEVCVRNETRYEEGTITESGAVDVLRNMGRDGT